MLIYPPQKKIDITKGKICKNCGKKYFKNYNYSDLQWIYSKTCSYKCASELKSKIAQKKPKLKKVCKFCNKIFEKPREYSPKQWEEAKVCSIECASNLRKKYRNKEEKIIAYRNLDRIKNNRAPWGSEEHREKIRQTVFKSMKFRSNGNFQNVQRGEYDINGTTIYFRSKWEANYALYLDFLIDHNEIEKWEFEPDTFVFDKIQFGTRSYTPDFKIFNKDGSIEYHEVKGFMDSRSKTKLKRMQKYYPEIKIVLIDSSQYKAISKQVGKLCKFY